jgi:hypothetical protein
MINPKIIAIDFDGCIVTNKFPDVGEPILEAVSAIKAEQRDGAKVILWTCRVGAQLEAAVNMCTALGIGLDAINKNLPSIVEAFGSDTRKIFANEYWDDRSVIMPPPLCADAQKYPDGICRGYRIREDDELLERCKHCTKNEFYEE